MQIAASLDESHMTERFGVACSFPFEDLHQVLIGTDLAHVHPNGNQMAMYVARSESGDSVILTVLSFSSAVIYCVDLVQYSNFLHLPLFPVSSSYFSALADLLQKVFSAVAGAHCQVDVFGQAGPGADDFGLQPGHQRRSLRRLREGGWQLLGQSGGDLEEVLWDGEMACGPKAKVRYP